MNKAANIDEYIAGFPASTQQKLEQVRKTIIKNAPAAEEIISYGMPAFRLKSNLVYFAGYKQHIGLYPGAAAVEAFKKEIAVYKWAKGSIQFPLDKPLPLSLIAKIVQYRVKAVLAK